MNNGVSKKSSPSVTVTLVFAGEKVDPDFITTTLNAVPDECIKVGELETQYNGLERESLVGKWKFAKVPVSEEDFEYGYYKEWCKFLKTKLGALRKLKSSGNQGSLQFHIIDDYYHESFIDTSLIEIIASAGLEMHISWLRTLPKISDSSHTVVIPQPKFFSIQDEEHFFTAIKTINEIQKIVGFSDPVDSQRSNSYVSGSYVLHLKNPYLDDNNLRRLVSLMGRYNLDMSSLRSQCNENNERWFKDQRSHWYKSVFGSED